MAGTDKVRDVWMPTNASQNRIFNQQLLVFNAVLAITARFKHFYCTGLAFEKPLVDNSECAFSQLGTELKFRG